MHETALSRQDALDAGVRWRVVECASGLRIDEGEPPLEAAYRELYEETSIRSVSLLAEAEGWFDYDLPPELAGRMERGLAAYAEGRLKLDDWAPQNDLTVRKLAAI